jgi:3-oxoacyl-[acyl-carrier protein] reductase
MRLKGKVAIVTGSGVGLGRAVALRYAQEGARVVVAEISAAHGAETVAEIESKDGEALLVQTDTGEETHVQRMCDAALRKYGRVDVLYNNAAILLRAGETRVHELTSEVWDATFRVNLRGLWLSCKTSKRNTWHGSPWEDLGREKISRVWPFSWLQTIRVTALGPFTWPMAV